MKHRHVHTTIYYRPQRSCEDYVFTSVCHYVHRGGAASVNALIPHPLGAGTPLEQAPPQEQAPPGAGNPPPGAGTPLGAGTPQDQAPPGTRHPPWKQALPRAGPPPEQAPFGSRPTLPGAETATAVDGTHPTGMHSCRLSSLLAMIVNSAVQSSAQTLIRNAIMFINTSMLDITQFIFRLGHQVRR